MAYFGLRDFDGQSVEVSGYPAPSVVSERQLTSNWTCVMTSLNASLLICNLGGYVYKPSRFVIVL